MSPNTFVTRRDAQETDNGCYITALFFPKDKTPFKNRVRGVGEERWLEKAGTVL